MSYDGDFESQDALDAPAVRRIGYSSRGNAGPVGLPDESPVRRIRSPREIDATQRENEHIADRVARQDKESERLAKEAATLRKKAVNQQREAEFRTKGQKFYSDSFGDLQPELDEQGAPRFSESNWKKAQGDDGAGGKTWALTRRNEKGQTETRAPKLVTSGDIKDPNLYYEFGGLRGEREVAGHVDDLAQSPDSEFSAVAKKHQTARNKAIQAASLKPLNDTVTAAATEVGNAKLQKFALDTQRNKLNEQLSAIDQDPKLKQTTGLLFTEPTSDARRLQGQRAALQSQADVLAKQSTDIDAQLSPGTSSLPKGALYAKHAQATVERDLWKNEASLSGIADQAATRRAWLKKQGRPEDGDGVLAQIVAKQEEFGVKASASAQRAEELQGQFTAEREKAAAEKSTLTEAQLQQQASGLENRRRSVATAFQKLGEDAAAGRLDPKTAAAAKQSLIEAERDYARSIGQLAGKGDALQKARQGEQNKAKLTIAQGEQLYNLEKNAGSVIQRMTEGGRDRDGETRKILSQSPAIKEAAKAAAFNSGDAEYSKDLYAKLPGKQIAINPAAFTIAGLTQAEGEAPRTWRHAIAQAVAKGDLDPKRAEPIRRDLARKELVAHEAAVDSTLDNDVFRRWLHTAHPELTESNILGWHAYEFNVPAGNPQLRAAAKEFLKAEPSSAQKIWNAMKMVGIGALNIGVDGVRAALPADGSGERALKEFSEGLRTTAMDPRLNDHWAGMIGQGLGSSLAFAIPAGAVGQFATAAGLSAKIAKWTVGGIIAAEGAAATGQQLYDEARHAGADREVADGARWLGAILGTTEVLPLGAIVRRAGSAKAFSIGSAIRTVVAEIGEETIQEIGQQAGNNAVARALYDSNRSLFEGFGDSAAGAGGSAAIMSILATVSGAVRYRRTVGLLNAAQQSRTQSEAALETVYGRPDVESVKQFLPPASTITAAFAEQRTELQTQIATEAAKKNPSEDVMLALHEQLAQLEIGAGSAARQLAAHALGVSQAIAQADAAPDFVQTQIAETKGQKGAASTATISPFLTDPATGQPMANPATVGANREAARALVKIGAGLPVANLTEAEAQGLEIIGEQLGSEMVRDVGGRPIVTDKARDWALDMAPATASLLPQTEGEMVQAMTAAAPAAKPARKDGETERRRDGEKKAPAANVSPSPPLSVSPSPAKTATTAPATISFTNEKGRPETATVPTGATVPSTQAPVRDRASAEQWLAETRPGAVRDVTFTAGTKPGKDGEKEGKRDSEKQIPVSPSPRPSLRAVGSAPEAVSPSSVTPGAVLEHLRAPMLKRGAAPRDIATAAVAVSKRVNATVAKYRGLFGGRVTITDKPGGPGRVA